MPISPSPRNSWPASQTGLPIAGTPRTDSSGQESPHKCPCHSGSAGTPPSHSLRSATTSWGRPRPEFVLTRTPLISCSATLLSCCCPGVSNALRVALTVTDQLQLGAEPSKAGVPQRQVRWTWGYGLFGSGAPNPPFFAPAAAREALTWVESRYQVSRSTKPFSLSLTRSLSRIRSRVVGSTLR